MNVSSETNYDELSRCTDDFNGAQLKAVCVEAGMIALRRGATELSHEDYMDGELECPPLWRFHNFDTKELLTSSFGLQAFSKFLYNEKIIRPYAFSFFLAS